MKILKRSWTHWRYRRDQNILESSEYVKRSEYCEEIWIYWRDLNMFIRFVRRFDKIVDKVEGLVAFLSYAVERKCFWNMTLKLNNLVPKKNLKRAYLSNSYFKLCICAKLRNLFNILWRNRRKKLWLLWVHMFHI